MDFFGIFSISASALLFICIVLILVVLKIAHSVKKPNDTFAMTATYVSSEYSELITKITASLQQLNTSLVTFKQPETQNAQNAMLQTIKSAVEPKIRVDTKNIFMAIKESASMNTHLSCAVTHRFSALCILFNKIDGAQFLSCIALKKDVDLKEKMLIEATNEDINLVTSDFKLTEFKDQIDSFLHAPLSQQELMAHEANLIARVDGKSSARNFAISAAI